MKTILSFFYEGSKISFIIKSRQSVVVYWLISSYWLQCMHLILSVHSPYGKAPTNQKLTGWNSTSMMNQGLMYCSQISNHIMVLCWIKKSPWYYWSASNVAVSLTPWCGIPICQYQCSLASCFNLHFGSWTLSNHQWRARSSIGNYNPES